MELKDMITLMERNYETNLETYWKKPKPKQLNKIAHVCASMSRTSCS